MVGVQLELSKFRLMPLLFLRYIISACCFICCCWSNNLCCCCCCWRKWYWCADGVSWRGPFPLELNSKEGLPKHNVLLTFEPISWIGFSEKLDWRNCRFLGWWSVLQSGLSKKMLWGKGIWTLLGILTLAWPTLELRIETTFLNLDTASPVSTIKFLHWTWSWGWDKRFRILWLLSTAALLASSTSSILTPNPKPKNKAKTLNTQTPKT